eukprot:1150577-Pelagomonas_calceolata.AAC.3
MAFPLSPRPLSPRLPTMPPLHNASTHAESNLQCPTCRCRPWGARMSSVTSRSIASGVAKASGLADMFSTRRRGA